MINVTDLDQRLMNHTTRVARTNHDGWMMTTAPSGGTRGHGIATVVALTRQRVGVALIGIGARLQGTPTRHAGESAAAF